MQVGLVAEFEVPVEDYDKFIAAARQELVSVRENEPGCLRFDIIVFDEEKGHGAFVEVLPTRPPPNSTAICRISRSFLTRLGTST